MDDVVLSHEVKRDQDLDRKPLDQTETESLEVVHLDEVIQVHAQKLERDHKVLPKHELVQLLYNIFLVFRVLKIQLLDQLGFHKTLLVEPLLVFEHFQRDKLFLLMVEDTHYDTEAALAELFDNFVAVRDVVVVTEVVLLLISVKAVVRCFVHFAPLGTAWLLGFLPFDFLSLGLVEEVYYGVLEHLALLVFIHVVTEYLNGFLAGHGEFVLSVSHH